MRYLQGLGLVRVVRIPNPDCQFISHDLVVRGRFTVDALGGLLPGRGHLALDLDLLLRGGEAGCPKGNQKEEEHNRGEETVNHGEGGKQVRSIEGLTSG